MKPILLLTILAVALPGCGGGDSSAGFDTPEAAFEAMTDSARKKDWAGVVNTFTPQAKFELSQGMLFMAGFMSIDEEKRASIAPVLAKHGVDLDETSGDTMPTIKDQAAFIADMLAWLDENADNQDEGFPVGKLADLSVDGDEAEGVILVEGDSARREPIGFRKIDGRWLVQPPMGSNDTASSNGGQFQFEGPESSLFENDKKPDAVVEEGDSSKAIRLTYEKPFGVFAEEGSLLFAQVAFKGEQAKNTTQWGKLILKAAKTDAGGSLELKNEPSFSGKDRTKQVFAPDTFDKDGNVLRCTLHLSNPDKAATKLTVLEGQITVKTGGNAQQVNIAQHRRDETGRRN